MRNVTLRVDERLLEEARAYARQRHVSLNRFVQELIEREIAGKPGSRMESALAWSKSKGLKSDNGKPLSRAEANERG